MNKTKMCQSMNDEIRMKHVGRSYCFTGIILGFAFIGLSDILVLLFNFIKLIATGN